MRFVIVASLLIGVKSEGTITTTTTTTTTKTTTTSTSTTTEKLYTGTTNYFTTQTYTTQTFTTLPICSDINNEAQCRATYGCGILTSGSFVCAYCSD